MAGRTVASQVTSAQPLVAELHSADEARLLYIDNMRLGLIVIVIVGHMAITYGAPLGEWYYREQG